MEQNTTEVVATPATAVVVEAAPKAPTKKSQADAIFNAVLAERADGQHPTNKEFRAAVLSRIQADLSVSVASAATMYNSSKKTAEAASLVTLGRDPKKVKISTGTGKKGRPAGSKNKDKVEATLAVATIEVAPTTEVAPVQETAEAVA